LFTQPEPVGTLTSTTARSNARCASSRRTASCAAAPADGAWPSPTYTRTGASAGRPVAAAISAAAGVAARNWRPSPPTPAGPAAAADPGALNSIAGTSRTAATGRAARRTPAATSASAPAATTASAAEAAVASAWSAAVGGVIPVACERCSWPA
jgi:hypothetical protein